MTEPFDFKGRPAATGTRRAAAAGLVVLAFIALAVTKPWDSQTLTPSASPTASPAAALAPERATLQPTAAPPLPTILDPSGFLVGSPPAGAWTSLAWSPIDPRLALAHVGSVVGWRHGFIAVGSDGAGGTPLWSSPDGVAWEPVPFGTSDGFWPGLRILAVTGFRGGLWAVGTTIVSTEPLPSVPMYLAAWRSADGLAWHPVAATVMPAPLGLVGPMLAAAAGDRLVLAWDELTPDGSRLGRVSWSADGSSWHQVEQASLPPALQVSALAESPDGGFLIGGQSTRDGVVSAVLLRSPAGSSWTPVPLPADQLAAAGTTGSVVWALESGANGVLAVGSADDRQGQQLWWRSSDGRTWSSVGSLWPLGRRPCASGAPTPGGGEGCGVYANGVVGSDGSRIVALPPDGSSGGWTSADGRTWTWVGAAPGSVPGSIDRVVVMPGGVLVDAAGRPWYGTAS